MYEVTSNKSSEKVNAAEVETLAAAGQFSVFAIRVWSSAAKQRMPIDHALGRFFNDFRCGPALQLFDECMSLLAASATRKVEIGCCPSNMYVVADENIPLNCFAALERENTSTAEGIIGEVINSRLTKAFCRSAKLYVQHLSKAGLGFTRPVTLLVVNK